MKYIKKFENNEYDGEFWLMRTDAPYLEISLQIIGVSQSEIKQIIYSKRIKKSDKCYISMRYNIVDGKIVGLNNDKWSWMPGDSNGKRWYINERLNYMGEVIVTDEDIEEYNLKKDAEKYNL